MNDKLLAYIPMDRRQTLARGETLPDRCVGAALFADISGFTPLTEALAADLGRKRGAEEVLRHINPVYEALIAELYRHGGSVIGFAGDAITCWFDDSPSPQILPQQGDGAARRAASATRATACALAMQMAMTRSTAAWTLTDLTVELSIKVAVAAGPARRFLVGDPDIQVLDVLAGDTLARMAAAERQAETGQTLVSEEIATVLADNLTIAEWRRDVETGHRCAVVARFSKPVPESPWPPLDPTRLTEEQLQAWALPAVVRRLQAGGQFLGDLRAVTPLFLRFDGIDYDQDEAAGKKLDAYIRWVQGVLERYEGSLIQLTVGDKGAYLYAAFGALLTHEDDTTRALTAALALQELPPTLSYIEPVQIGITQGQVWTGACGSATRHTFAAMGNPVNMAVRLMAQAKPGQVLVSQAAADLAQKRIRFRDPGAISIKGHVTPLPVVAAVRVETTRRRLSEQFTQPMVGRDEELNRLLELLDEVEDGASRVATLEAEAGLGKSRLVTEWASRARRRGLHSFLGAGQSIEQHTPYRAWQDLLAAFLELDEWPDIADRQAQVETRIHALAPAAAVYSPLLDDILDLALPDNELTQGLSAQGRQQALITLLLQLFGAAAAQSPLLLVLEDAHWLDALSWELAVQLARGLEVSDAPFLLLLVTRPVGDPPAQAMALRRLPYSRHLSLTALPAPAIAALMANHLGVAVDGLPSHLLELVQSRAEGNPFFAEELLLNLQAHGVVTVQPDPDSGQLRCHLQKELERVTAALPDSLQGVIMARIDRLPSGQQRVLKLAAVIGRSFAYSPLHHLYRHYRADQAVALAVEIAHLEERDLVLTETLEPELTYLFKHIVIRDVAYETLLYEQRRPLHRSVATWYEQAHPGEAVTSPYLALLVHHYHQAEDVDQERRYAYLAGQQAAARYANEDALGYFSRALELIPATDRAQQYQVLWAREEIHDRLGLREAQAVDLAHLAALASTVAQRIAVALRYGAYHNNVGEYKEAIAVSDQAYHWANESGDDTGRAQAMIDCGQAFMSQGDYEMANERYQRAHALAQATPAPIQVARAWGGLGEVAFRQGDYATATHHHQQTLHLWQELGDRPGQVQSLRNLGQVANAQGEYETARHHFLQALPLVQQIGDRPQEGQLLLDLGESDWRQGAYPRAETYLQQSLTLAQTTGDRRTAAAALRNLGAVAAHQGQYDRAMGYMEQNLVISREIGDRDGVGRALNGLGLVATYQGQYDRATDYLEQSLVISQEIGDRARASTTLNNLGLAVTYQGQYDRAIGYYEQSLVISQDIGDRARASTTLNNLGLVATNQGQYDRAIDYYEQSLVISQDIGNQDGTSRTLNNLGLVATHQGQYDRAIDYYEQSLVISQDIGNRVEKGRTLNNLGLVDMYQGQYDRAMGYLEQSLVISQEIGNRAGEGQALNNLGLVATYQGQYDRAIGYYEQSLVITREIGDREMEGRTLNNLGLVATYQGQHDRAMSYLEQGLVIAQEIGDRAGKGEMLNNMGALALAQAAFPQAQTFYRQASIIHQEIDQPQFLVDDWAGLALVAVRQGDLETAGAHADRLLAAWADNVTLDGASEPMRAFHFTWQVCQALGLAQGDEVLTAAARVMKTYLDQQPDPAAQAVYLQQPHHQALWTAWQALQDSAR